MMGPPPSMNCVVKGIFSDGFTKNMPITRAAMTPIFMKVLR